VTAVEFMEELLRAEAAQRGELQTFQAWAFASLVLSCLQVLAAAFLAVALVEGVCSCRRNKGTLPVAQEI
jgi:hypothetical protein